VYPNQAAKLYAPTLLHTLGRERDGVRMSRRRFVARGVPGGYRIWDSKLRRWWGDHYELCPDDLLVELNGDRRPDMITDLLRRYRAQKR